MLLLLLLFSNKEQEHVKGCLIVDILGLIIGIILLLISIKIIELKSYGYAFLGFGIILLILDLSWLLYYQNKKQKNSQQ